MRNLIKILLILLLIPVGLFFLFLLIPLFLILLFFTALFPRRQSTMFRWYHIGGFPGRNSSAPPPPQAASDSSEDTDACDVECTVIESTIVDSAAGKDSDFKQISEKK